ncbi:MAG: hypothetical protein WC686_05445, partial [Candidatus Shapirobacteria bacterium]
IGTTHKSLLNLAVAGIPYESPLFYLDSGAIERHITADTKYVITNKDFLHLFPNDSWQVVDSQLGDYLLKKINNSSHSDAPGTI